MNCGTPCKAETLEFSFSSRTGPVETSVIVSESGWVKVSQVLLKEDGPIVRDEVWIPRQAVNAILGMLRRCEAYDEDDS